MYTDLEEALSTIKLLQNAFCIKDKTGKIVTVSSDFNEILKNSFKESGIIKYNDKYYVRSKQTIRSKDEMFDLEILTDVSKIYEKMNSMEKEIDALRIENKSLKVDKVTSLPTRRELDLYIDGVTVSNGTLILVMCDVDNFKLINDRYGHKTGDRVLNIIGNSFSQNVREEDFVGRYGGEEFLLIFKTDNINIVAERLNKVREYVEKNIREKNLPHVTFSSGIAICELEDEPKDTIESADEALYYMKNNGKNGDAIYDNRINCCKLLSDYSKNLSKI